MTAPSFTLTALTLTPDLKQLQPVEQFCLFDNRTRTLPCEYCWGLQPGELDLRSSMNHVSVRKDVAELFADNSITIIPDQEILEIMVEFVNSNFDCPLDQRRRCFDVLPTKSFQYKIIPGRKSSARRPPLYLYDSIHSTFLQFDHPYTDLPRLTSEAYPFYSIMHSDSVIPYSGRLNPLYLVERLGTMFACITPRGFGSSSFYDIDWTKFYETESECSRTDSISNSTSCTIDIEIKAAVPDTSSDSSLRVTTPTDDAKFDANLASKVASWFETMEDGVVEDPADPEAISVEISQW